MIVMLWLSGETDGPLKKKPLTENTEGQNLSQVLLKMKREMTQLEAEIQALVGAPVTLPPKVNRSKVELLSTGRSLLNVSYQFFSHTALNLEAPKHRNLLISALVGNFLPAVKKQIHNSVAT